MNVERLRQILDDLEACKNARDWVAFRYGPLTRPEELWLVCERGDWLVWLLSELYVQRLIQHNVLVQAACAAARTSLEAFTDEAEHDDAVKTLDAVEAYGKDMSNETARDAMPLRFMKAHPPPGHYAHRLPYARWNIFSAVETVCGDWNDEAVRQIANAAQDTCLRAWGPEWVRELKCIADAVRAVVPWSTVEAALAQYALPVTA